MIIMWLRFYFSLPYLSITFTKRTISFVFRPKSIKKSWIKKILDKKGNILKINLA